MTFDPVSKSGYELAFEDTFAADQLDRRRWIAHHLPQWSTREASAARYRLGRGGLELAVEEDQPPWCPEFDDGVRVSSLQTGIYAGPLGSAVGQHRFNPEAVVREEQRSARLYTPTYGYFELRAAANIDSSGMVALWMIGYEDVPEHSGEICIAEIFGRTTEANRAAVGMGAHPFGDPAMEDDFVAETLPIDIREYHIYAANWTPSGVDFFVDHSRIRRVEQSPGYPMQFMLGVYDFPSDTDDSEPHRQVFKIDYLRGYRRIDPEV